MDIQSHSAGQTLAFLSRQTKGMLFFESCVFFSDGEEINPTSESQDDPTQAYSGIGCRPTEALVFGEVRKLFEFVHFPMTQPWHEEFPTDWGNEKHHKAPLQRAIFVASREPIGNDLLDKSLLHTQRRHE
jgi:hypothetical protein